MIYRIYAPIDVCCFLSFIQECNAVAFLVCFHIVSLSDSLFKAVDAGEEELRNGDLALLVRRFPAVNDLTVRFASRLTSAYEVLAEVRAYTCKYVPGVILTKRVTDMK